MSSNHRLKVHHIMSGDIWAGAEVMGWQLLKGLQRHDDLDISAVLFNEGRLADEIRKMGIRLHVVDEGKKSFPGILFSLARILRAQRPNIIHSHGYKENIAAYLLSRALGGVKLMSTQHGMPRLQGEKDGLKSRLVGKLNIILLARCFDMVSGVSQDIKRCFLESLRFNRDKVSVIHNGIQIPKVSKKKKKRGTFLIGSTGRLFPVKDYPLMIEIARVMGERTDGIQFALAGDGPELPRLQGLIERSGLNGTFLLKGHLSNMSAFYQDIDLYLNTSLHEGIPMSILEAMSHGIPVIAPDVGGIGEIIEHGKDGYLIPGRDCKAFSEKCFMLYKKKRLRKKMSRAAREKMVARFSAEKMVGQYHDLYWRLGENERPHFANNLS